MSNLLIIIGAILLALVAFYVIVRASIWLTDRKQNRLAKFRHAAGPGIVAGSSYGEYGLGSTDVGGGSDGGGD